MEAVRWLCIFAYYSGLAVFRIPALPFAAQPLGSASVGLFFAYMGIIPSTRDNPVRALRSAAPLEKYRTRRGIALWISRTGGLAGAILGFAGA